MYYVMCSTRYLNTNIKMKTRGQLSKYRLPEELELKHTITIHL